jgi:hypothetical protein
VYFGTETQYHRKTSFHNPLPINISAEHIIIIFIIIIICVCL